MCSFLNKRLLRKQRSTLMSAETHFGKPEQPFEPNKTESKTLTGFMQDGALSILKEIQWFKENNKINNSIYSLFESLQNSIHTFIENQAKNLS